MLGAQDCANPSCQCSFGVPAQEMRALYQAFEKDLKPIFDQLQHVKGINTPDYGSLTDWAISQRAAEAAKSRDGSLPCVPRFFIIAKIRF